MNSDDERTVTAITILGIFEKDLLLDASEDIGEMCFQRSRCNVVMIFEDFG